MGINATNQSLMQRFLSVSSIRKARKALWIYTAGTILFIMVSAYNGFILYATYHDCDPLTTKVRFFVTHPITIAHVSSLLVGKS